MGERNVKTVTMVSEIRLYHDYILTGKSGVPEIYS